MAVDSSVLNSLFLTLIVFFPILGGLVQLALPSSSVAKKIPHKVALGTTFITFIMSLILAMNFKPSTDPSSVFNFQFVDKFSWIPVLNSNYHIAVDGLSLPMVLLTSLIMIVAVLASWKIEKMPRMYFFLMMIMQTAVYGVFTSLDLLLFFVMWELELIPMYFLIGIWGGARREYAAMKFVLYTAFASAFMLIVFLGIYFNTGTFDYVQLVQGSKAFANLGMGIQVLAFVSLMICFAVKLPMVPFHTWLPDAHVEAPTALSIVLAGVLLKMGSYGMIRFGFGLFPDVMSAKNTILDLSFWLACLGTINIIYGAFLALAQTDMKRVIAYSSVSHMGFVLLGMAGMNANGLNGAILQMFTHGTITAMMFLFVGVVYDRTHTREIAKLGGLAQQMPIAGAFFVAISMAGVAVPGMNSFVSEFLVFAGSFQNHPYLCALAAFSVVIGAGYTLWLNERVFFGPLPSAWRGLPDINKIETFSVVLLMTIVIATGLYPALLLDIINPATKQIMMIMGIPA
ncbi:MAG: NADH-quinone oxidoreductase subunit M [Cyanobacteriota bacterium]